VRAALPRYVPLVCFLLLAGACCRRRRSSKGRRTGAQAGPQGHRCLTSTKKAGERAVCPPDPDVRRRRARPSLKTAAPCAASAPDCSREDDVPLALRSENGVVLVALGDAYQHTARMTASATRSTGQNGQSESQGWRIRDRDPSASQMQIGLCAEFSVAAWPKARHLSTRSRSKRPHGMLD
jgi:hypothetical protein